MNPHTASPATDRVSRRYHLPPGVCLPAAGSVVRRGVLQALTTSDEVVAATQRRCERLLESAAAEAQSLVLPAAHAAERAVWERALLSLRGIDQARDALLAQAESFLMETARAALQRLMLDVPPEWPSLSGVRLLLRELRDLETGDRTELRVHPQDLPRLREAASPPLSVPLVSDATLQIGQCVLVCAQGELRADYAASVASLVESLELPSED
jgi:flagellar biosynthesis/type III secretory pathway protein FliH